MHRLERLSQLRIASDAFVLRLIRLICVAAAPLFLLVALRAVGRLASSPGEILLGVLASLTCALALVILGLVLHLALGRGDT